MRVHTKLGQFSCRECGKTFSEKVNLKCHMRVHKRERPFVCEECEKTFSQRVHLRLHRRVHAKGKVFPCKQCGKTFSYKEILAVHMSAHTGRNPFRCKECGQTFFQKGDLMIHMRVHGTEKVFSYKEGEILCNYNDGVKKSSDQVHTGKTATDKCSFISIVRNNLEATTCVDNNFCICLIEASFLDDVIISLPACPHPNVAVLYDVGFFRSFPMLMMERMEAPLSTLLSDVGDQVTLRERLM
jgi:hypothetical protein